jgi:hypothetical protein
VLLTVPTIAFFTPSTTAVMVISQYESFRVYFSRYGKGRARNPLGVRFGVSRTKKYRFQGTTESIASKSGEREPPGARPEND